MTFYVIETHKIFNRGGGIREASWWNTLTFSSMQLAALTDQMKGSCLLTLG